MKLCKDCKWVGRVFPYFLFGITPAFARCLNPKSASGTGDWAIPVSGKPQARADSQKRCADQRSDERCCGPDAKWFEPKA